MRDQLESFGIAEPDVRVEGENIIVDLPGVSDQSEAFDALKVSGIVELRPVLQCQAGSLGDTSTSVPGQQRPDRQHGVPIGDHGADRHDGRRRQRAGARPAFAGGAGSMFARRTAADPRRHARQHDAGPDRHADHRPAVRCP